MPDPNCAPKPVCRRCYMRFCLCNARFGLVKAEELSEFKRPMRQPNER